MTILYNTEVVKCPECDSNHIIVDYIECEVVCRDCGLVLQDQPLRGEFNQQIYITKYGLTKIDKSFFHKLYPQVPDSTIRDKREYNRLLKLVASNLQMNSLEKKTAEYFLTAGIKKLHSRVKSDTVIAGVCRYSIIFVSPMKGRQLWFKRDVFKSSKLTPKAYTVIKRNIESIFNI